MNEEKITSLTAISLILLKETRLERGIHQAQLAEKCNKTPSAWGKIETGKTTFTMEMFYCVCSALNTPPSSVMAAAERYANLFIQNGWAVLNSQLESEDLLLNEAQEYYRSEGFKARPPFSLFSDRGMALSGPINMPNGQLDISDVFRFALDMEFKSNQMEKPETLDIKSLF